MDEKTLDEAVEYFKSNHGFDRMIKKMKEKYISFERELPGTITIDNPSNEEKEALSGFMKKDYRKNKSILVNLKKFQKRLDETRFSGVSIKEILEKYYGREIISNKEQKKRDITNFEQFINEIKTQCKCRKTVDTIDKILSKNADILRIIKKEFSKDKENLRRELKKAINALENLPDEKISLPVFAARVNADPHSLDRNSLAGRIFLKLLVMKDDLEDLKQEHISYTEEIAEIYYINNILIDEMSNMVLQRNLVGYIKNIVNEGWQAFSKCHEAIQVTLYNLSKIDEIKASKNKCLVVENPGVFANILQDETLKDIPIVCTYGQVKLAGIILLEKLVKSNVKLFYSGDIDPEGMQIADKLKQRFKENISLIGFEKETYLHNMSNVSLNDTRLKKLDSLKDRDLIELSILLKQYKKSAYEELNIDNLKNMLKSW